MMTLRRRFEAVLDDPSPWMLPVLVPLSLLYRGLAALHSGLYRSGLLKTKSLPVPVISVGNLTLGGGGKTPLVMWLARALAERGISPAVLSRGYGRKSGKACVVDPEGPWQFFGDEPSMLARKLEKIPVGVSADRYRAGMEVLKQCEVDLFILDDGFQHYALERCLDIVAVDDRRRFGTGRLIPAGLLRGPLSRLKHADLLIVTKASAPDSRFEKELNILSEAPVAWFEFKPAGLVPLNGATELTETDGYCGPAFAFCGVADPEGFRSSLVQAGIEVAGIMPFPDHHPYCKEDVSRISAAAGEAGARLMVTTEKDAVRWPANGSGIPVYFLSMEAIPLKGEDEIMNILSERILK